MVSGVNYLNKSTIKTDLSYNPRKLPRSCGTYRYPFRKLLRRRPVLRRLWAAQRMWLEWPYLLSETLTFRSLEQVSGGGSGTPGPLVSFPGAYTGNEPGILIGEFDEEQIVSFVLLLSGSSFYRYLPSLLFGILHLSRTCRLDRRLSSYVTRLGSFAMPDGQGVWGTTGNPRNVQMRGMHRNTTVLYFF